MLPGNLSDRLRNETRGTHDNAENHALVKKFFDEKPFDKNDKKLYLIYLYQLLAIYQALETALEKNHLGAFFQLEFFASLFRTAKLKTDIQALEKELGPLDAKKELHATLKYVNTINSASRTELLGHFYTRFFGDLSGGQFLKSVLAKQVGDAATSHYDFSDIPMDTIQIKNRLRKKFNTIQDEQQQKDALKGANDSFALTTEVFDQILRPRSRL